MDKCNNCGVIKGLHTGTCLIEREYNFVCEMAGCEFHWDGAEQITQDYASGDICPKCNSRQGKHEGDDGSQD